MLNPTELFIITAVIAAVFGLLFILRELVQSIEKPKKTSASASAVPLPLPPSKRIQIVYPKRQTLEAYNVKCLPGQIVTVLEVIDEPIQPWDEPNQVSPSVNYFTIREDSAPRTRDRRSAAEYLRNLAERMEIEGGAGHGRESLAKQRAIALRSIALDIEGGKI